MYCRLREVVEPIQLSFAMRECICGLYEADIVIYLLKLLTFLVVGLVVGLWIRIPFEGLNHYMEERMEDTEMM